MAAGNITYSQAPEASPATWSPRYDQSSVAMADGSIIIMGGNNGNTFYNDVWISTNNGASWTQVTQQAGWSPREQVCAVVMPDGSIVAMAGWAPHQGGYYGFADVWRSTDNGSSWTEMNSNAPWGSRTGVSAVSLPDGSIVLMGGINQQNTNLNDVWRSDDYGASWTQVTPVAEWSPRNSQSTVAMPDGSIVLMGGSNADSTLMNDVWRSTDDGATWTEQVPGPVYPDVGTIAGMQLSTAANGDWQDSSATVLVDAGGDTNPSLAVLTLGNPGQLPAVTTHLITLSTGPNGIVTSLLPQATQNGRISGQFPYTNAALKGLRAVQIDNLIYAFYTLDANDLAVCTISISEGNVVNVLNTQQVTYSSAGNQMSTFNVQGNDTGIMVVSKQGGSVLDISFIPVSLLGSGGNPVVNPEPIMQVQNLPTFTPVPDTTLYSTMLTNDLATGDPVIVGVSDFQGTVYSWYIDLSNPGKFGQEPMPITGPLPGSVSLSQGSTSYNPTGVNDLVAVAFSPTGSQESWGGIYNIDLSGMGQAGSGWNTLYEAGPLGHPYFGSPGLPANNPVCTAPQGNGVMRQNMIFSAVQGQPGGTATVWCSILGSNTLIPDPSPPGQWSYTQNNDPFTTYGNVSIPVGIIDGVPPIALNGYQCDCCDVNSEVDLVSQGTDTTGSTVTTGPSRSLKYGNNFFDDILGIGASYTHGVKNSSIQGAVCTTLIKDSFPLNTQYWETSSNAWMVYLGPNFQTEQFWIYDYNGNPPAGNVMTVYLTYPLPGVGYSQQIQAYNITNPPTSGPLGSAMQSPFYNDFRQWDWSSWSGGWNGRDWTSYSGADSYTVTPILQSPLDFSGGAVQTGSLDMSTSAGSTHETTRTVDADASILGFGGSGSFEHTQDSTVSNTIDEGIQFTWMLKDPAPRTCPGYDEVQVEPVIITPNPGSYMPLPWVPPAFEGYQPWLLTYNLLSYNRSSSCGASTVLEPGEGVGIAVMPMGSGSVRVDPANPRMGDQVRLNAIPAPGYTFSHWQAYGVDLLDYSSATTEGRVRTQISTVRAYFEKQESDLVTVARLSGGMPDNRITISGTIPANLTPGVALDPKVPVKVIVGNKEFPFGEKAGTVQVLSDSRISFNTNTISGGHSTLDLDYTRNSWEFSADTIDHMSRTLPAGNTVRVWITAKNTAARADLPFTGSQSFMSAGTGGLPENQLFSFDSGTRVIGSFAYPCQEPGQDSFIIEGARFNTSAFNPDSHLKFTINPLAFDFPNATARNGDHYLYTKSSKDCNVSLDFDTATGVWSATLEGQRLSNTYWGDTQEIGLRIGSRSANGKVTTGLSYGLSWPGSQSPLTAEFSGSPAQGSAPLSVSFTDRSQGSPTSWYWSFGDGSTSTERNPVHVYTVKGNYSVFLLVKNGQDTSSLLIPDYITVGTTPSLQADFVVSPVNGTAPLTVKCTDKSTGKPGMYVYNFGDGTSATGQNPVHTYKVPGNYTITLTITKYNPATGTIESSVANKTNVITVTPVPFIMPVAKFTASPVNGTMPLSVKFTDRSEGNPTMYNYDFGDGVNETGPNPVHTYRFPGVYNVTLTVLKNDAANGSVVGNTSVQNGLIHVSGK